MTTKQFSLKFLWDGYKQLSLPSESIRLWEAPGIGGPSQPPPASIGSQCVRASSQILCAPFFLTQEEGKHTDSNSLNSVIYSFLACQNKLKRTLSENAAEILLCKCGCFVKQPWNCLTHVWSDCVRFNLFSFSFLFYFFLENHLAIINSIVTTSCH